MKKLFLFAFGAFALCALGACSDDDNGYVPPRDQDDKYRGGFYVLNEGGSTTPEASINYYADNTWQLRIDQANNAGEKLGVTGTTAVFDNKYMYVVSKMSPYLVKIRLSDFVRVDAITEDAFDGQARGFALVDSKTGVLTTTAGAYRVTLDPLALAAEPFVVSNSLRGDVIVTGGYIFLLEKTDNAVAVYDSSTFKFVKNAGAAVTGFAQIGNALWAANEDKLVKIDLSALTSEEFPLGDGLSVSYNSMAFTPTGLHASPSGEVLYFVQAQSAWTGRDIYKFTIATGKAEKFFAAPVVGGNQYSTYGAGVNVNPDTGDLYLVYTEDGFSDHYLNTDIYVVGADGTEKQRIPYTSENETVYWFPSVVLFR